MLLRSEKHQFNSFYLAFDIIRTLILEAIFSFSGYFTFFFFFSNFLTDKKKKKEFPLY